MLESGNCYYYVAHTTNNPILVVFVSLVRRGRGVHYEDRCITNEI